MKPLNGYHGADCRAVENSSVKSSAQLRLVSDIGIMVPRGRVACDDEELAGELHRCSLDLDGVRVLVDDT